jgi:EmrB/QacA subfamily drug resistance transporter
MAADRLNYLVVHALLPFHMNRDQRMSRRHQQQNMENQPENQAKDDQDHIENRGKRLAIQEQPERGHQRSEDVDHRRISSGHQEKDGASRFRWFRWFRNSLQDYGMIQPLLLPQPFPPNPMKKERLIPLIVATALFMENMDSTVIATSLPAIAADIGTSPLTLKLAITSYLLSLAVFIPASGWTADRFGARMVFSLAVAVFILGSIGCALSGSVTDFVIARIVQGIGGAMMTPVGRLVLLRSIDKSALVNAMAWVTVPALIGPVIGPPLGGFITTYFSWHWIFLINIPIGLLGIFMAMRYIDPIRSKDPERFDLYGLVLAGIGVGGIAFGLSVAGLNLLPWTIVTALVAIGSISMTLYIIHARRTSSPVLDFTLLRLPTLRASIIGGFLFRLGIGALPFLLPLLMQVGFGLSPFRSGLVTFSSAVGAMGMKTLAARIIKTFGFRNIMMINAVISSVFLAACALFTVTTPLLLIMIILVVGGFFRSLQFTAINTVAYAEVEPAQMSRATTLVSVNQQLAISTGVALGAFSVESTMLVRHVQELSAAEFAPAFMVVAVISAVSAYFFYKMPVDAGHQVSGRRIVVISDPTREPEAEEEAASETVTARDQRL